MPWGVKKSGSKYAIYKKDTGKIVGHSTSRAKAEASVRVRYANTHGEFSEHPRNMSKFCKQIADRVLAEEMEIDGETYAQVPEDIASNLSGSIAIGFGIKKRDNKMWIPKDRLQDLIECDAEITAELES